MYRQLPSIMIVTFLLPATASSASAQNAKTPSAPDRGPAASATPEAGRGGQDGKARKRKKGDGWRPLGVNARGAESIVEPDATEGDALQSEIGVTRGRKFGRSSGPMGVRRMNFAAGYRGIGMDFTADSANGPVGHEAAANALFVTVDGSLPITGRDSRLVIDIVASYALSLTDDGLQYLNSDDDYYELDFTAHEARAGLRAGFRVLANRLLVAARADYRLDALILSTTDNPANLPSERRQGVSAGGLLQASLVSRRLDIHAGVDWLLSGRRVQTENRKDGAESDTAAWWLHGGLDFALVPKLSFSVRLALERASTEWTGPSQRLADVTSAMRDDINYYTYLGFGRTF